MCSSETLQEVLNYLYIYLFITQLMYHIYVNDIWNFANKMWAITTVSRDSVLRFSAFAHVKQSLL